MLLAFNAGHAILRTPPIKTAMMKFESSKEREIYSEQVRLLYSALPMSVIAILINALVLVIVQWPVLNHSLLLVWLLVILLVSGSRSLLGLMYKRLYHSDNIQRWGSMFLVGVVLAALVWTSTTLFLFPENDIAHQVFLTFILAGMSAGAVTSLSFLRLPIIIFMLILLVPLAIRFFLIESAIALAMGTMVIVFLVILLMSAIRFYESTRQNITLRIEAIIREKALEESENKYRHIFNDAPLGIAHYDSEGLILDCNETFSRLAGNHSSQDVVGKPITASTADEKYRDVFSRSLSGEATQYEGPADVIGGNHNIAIRIFTRGMGTEGDNSREGVAIVEDITEDKRVERLKNEFISTVSHELRTPLTSIRGALGLILGGVTGTFPEETHSMLKVANTNTQRLLLLINDILDIGKIESGAIELDMKPVSIMPLVETTVENNRFYGEEFGVSFRITARLTNTCIRVDRDRFEQALVNILSNAAKFSPEGSTVEIGVRQLQDKIRIFVTDHGPGIPVKFQPLIFERFTQWDASDTRSTRGAGLGLSISQAMIEQMKGEIGFETKVDEGTTFYIDFPVTECHQ